MTTRPAFRLLPLFLTICQAWATSPFAAKRERFDLTANWRFLIDVDDLGEREKWYREGFDCSRWSTVTVPKAWDLYDKGLWGYEGIGWYSTTIDRTLARSGKLQRLRFGRVMYFTKAWLNGVPLGENIGGYLPFEFDVTGRLSADRTNVLVLRVDNRTRLDWLPAARNIEWMQYGGILQPVILETTAPTQIAGVTIHAVPEGNGATVDCEVEVVSREAGARDLRIRAAVDGSPTAVTAVDVQLPPGGTLRQRLHLKLDRANRWSPLTPFLYTARVTLASGGKTVDAIATRFGVRRIEARSRQLLLNGEPIRLQGVNRYDEYARYGPNAPRSLVIRDLRAMKDAGVNLVRVHYPQSPDLLTLYDEMGFLMMEEVALNWWGNGFSGKGDEVQRENILNHAIPFLEGMIRRDKNHPSVVIWSMCNESKTDNEAGITVMRKLIRRAKELDPTRLVTFVINNRETQGHRAFEEADLVAFNVYVGGYGKRPAQHVAEVRELIGKAAEEHIRRQCAYWPGKPLLVAEFGTPGVPGMHGDVTYTEEYQAALIEEVGKAIQRSPELSGGILWSWADYYHRPNYIKYAAFGPYGVVTVDRRRKAAYKTLLELYGGEATASGRH